MIKLSLSHFGPCYFIPVDSSSKDRLGKEALEWGLLALRVAFQHIMGSKQSDWLIILASHCTLSPASKPKYLPGAVAGNSEEVLEGFVCLYNMEANIFVWGWEKLLWHL